MSKQAEIYLGNPNLKKANVAYDFSPEDVKEFVKCSQDPVYFIREYIRIVSLDEGIIPFRNLLIPPCILFFFNLTIIIINNNNKTKPIFLLVSIITMINIKSNKIIGYFLNNVILIIFK